MKFNMSIKYKDNRKKTWKQQSKFKMTYGEAGAIEVPGPLRLEEDWGTPAFAEPTYYRPSRTYTRVGSDITIEASVPPERYGFFDDEEPVAESPLRSSTSARLTRPEPTVAVAPTRPPTVDIGISYDEFREEYRRRMAEESSVSLRTYMIQSLHQGEDNA